MTALTAVDLFAGAGGATQGLRDAGFQVLGAVELDSDAARSYKLNHPDTRLYQCDIRTLPAQKMRRDLGLASGELTLLKACPPCQGFSTLSGGRSTDEARDDLIRQVVRFVRAFKPRAILLENVPGLARDPRFGELTSRLSGLGYSFSTYRLNAIDFGVPQRRSRLVVLAVKGLRSRLPENFWDNFASDERPSAVTAGNALERLDQESRVGDPLSKYRKLAAKTLARVSAIPVGGTRFDLPEHLRLRCHNDVDRKGKGARRATGSYGRIRLDSPAPTMTTRCTTPACGSFIHPIENRGITLREAAWFQTFPYTYDFEGTYESIERQIGNAVPVRMAKYLGLAVVATIVTVARSGGD
ncbi:DNA cytosine methyltransferase [Actinosynnema sp. NPDC020468]|uniref:DNA cytosine methyltransferase n=1 Tax=Actinosynnema sp. NPDC020468 TaxID=3154488 RepID=UPI0033EA42A3